MSGGNERCARLLQALAFECAGIDAAQRCVDALSGLVAVFDLQSPTNKAARRVWLEQGELAEKAVVSIDLPNGETISGKFAGYQAAAVRMLAEDGAFDVPVELLPLELLRCFPHDPTLQAILVAEKIEAATARFEEAFAAANEIGNRIEGLAETIRELREENSALQTENGELRAQLREAGR